LTRHPLFWAYAALVSVCFFWGTTYLGIKMALESFPPLTLVSVRFLISGALLLSGALLFGAHLPRGAELRRTALNGVVILGIGNGCLVYAETWIPSGLAALIITISPFWMIGLNAILPPREKIYPPTLAGMAVGLSGAVLLVGPGALRGGAEGINLLKGFLALQLGSISWSGGSLLQRKQKNTAHPIVSGAVQQLAAGLAFLLPALVAGGEVQWSPRGMWALAYLVTFGSIVGYSSYVIALDRLPVAVVSLYNYINPVVAVALGWLFYREPFGVREAAAMLIIFLGVAIVRRLEAGKPKI
jgi:drug/metabolite transporter (DMT)-like permease